MITTEEVEVISSDEKVKGHVTPRKSNSDTLRLFLFSYNGTKINSGFAQDATHRPATHHWDGRFIS